MLFIYVKMDKKPLSRAIIELNYRCYKLAEKGREESDNAQA
jgi:hypothetical protein